MQVNDIFLFSCFTGLTFSIVKKLFKNDFVIVIYDILIESVSKILEYKLLKATQ